MGLGQEMMEEMAAQYYYAEYLAENGFWETKDGRTLRISEMDTRHIQNCLRMLGRTGDDKTILGEMYVRNMKEELGRRK